MPGAVGFTGREAELHVLADALVAARAGEGVVVVVTGEAGIGKTRFCREVAAHARSAGFAVGWGTCWPDGGAPPLWPWQAILNGLGDGTAADTLAEDPGGSTVEPARFARFTAVAGRLATACAAAPALVVLDDAHAADAGALLLTRFIARHLAGLPLVLLLAGRPDPASRPNPAGPPRWHLGSEATLIELGRFDLAETADFLRSRGHPVPDDDLLRVLLRLTGGHPLHLQHILAAGACGPTGTGKAGGVRAELARAVERLSEPARSILSRAAVLGSTPLLGECATVCAAPPAAVQDALDEARPAGLVTVEQDAPDRFSFGHDLVRESFQAVLSAEERQAAHAGAAQALAGAGPARLARRAHHALRAAHRSPADTREAVRICRLAARVMIAGFDYERACSLLAAAAGAHARAGLDDPVTALLVEWAEATLMCGRLAESRALFERAVRGAQAEHEPVLLAQATLGLGGVWVNEHRTRIEWERMVGLQRQALAGLHGREKGLRHRLVARLAAERLYRGGPIEPVCAALDEARRLGDGKGLAEALSLCHHGMLTAEHTWVRLALAEELIAVAAPAGDGLLALLGLCWRTVDLFHLGDPRAPTAHADLRERADALGCLSVLYIAEAMAVMLLIRAGRLAEAEAKANTCFALGSEVGDADAPGYLGVHLTTIRWLQGRDAEMLDTVAQIADSPGLNPAEFGFQATLVCLTARAGRLDEARILLDRLTEPGLANLPDSSTWLAGMLAIVEAAHLLGDAPRARLAYDLLKPYADLPIMPSLAVTCFGSTRRVLGLAAVTAGDLSGGIAHLERAVTATRLLGNRPVTAITMADLARAYLRRQHGAGDREQAAALLARARDEAIAMEMTAHATAWTRLLHDVTHRTGTIACHGRQWTVAVGERRVTVSDRRGVRYLAQLLVNPGRPIAALELAGHPGDTTLAAAARQPVLDDRAKADYRRRVRELSTAIDRADDRDDPVRAGQLRAELKALLVELRRVTGKGGHTRDFADPGERARTAVRHALKRAIDEITAADPGIGALLRATVSTGATCCYTPDDANPVRWTQTP